MPPSMQGGTALVLMKEPTLPAVLPVPGTERGEGGEPSPVHRRRMELHPRLGVTSDASAVLFPILREQPHQRRRDRLFLSLRRRAHLLSIPASYRIVGHSCRRSHIANATFPRLGNQVYRPSPQIRPGRSCFRGSFPSGGIFTQQSGNMVGYFAASVRPVSSLFSAAIKRGGQKTCRGSFIRSDMSRSCIRCVYDIARVLR